MTQTSTKVVVIGGGISGLSAARVLQDADVDVVVLEAQDRVGGRTHTIQDPSHGVVDVGGAYIGPGQNRVFRLAKNLGLEFYNVNEKEKTVLSLQGSWSTFLGAVPPLKNPIALLDLNHVMRTLDSMALQVPVDSPWKAKQALQWDSMSVKEFVHSIAWTSATVELIRLTVQAVLTSEMHEVSLLFFLWYIHSGQGITRLTTITNGAQEKKMFGGAQQMSEGMARLLGDTVHLNSAVVNVTETETGVIVTDCNNTKYQCEFVISAVPQALLNRISFKPPLPGSKLQLIQRIPMGSIIKTNMYYETAFWKDLGFCGSAISDSGPVGYCVDDTKPDGSHPSLMAFILADKSRDMASLTPEQRKQALCQHFAKVFKSDEFLQPIGYIEKNWMKEEFSGGCYVSTFPPGVLTKYGRELRKPVGRTHFAGTETASEWMGYMEGAIQAGERAAREVLYELGLIRESDIWQSEPESMDYPAHPVARQWLEDKLPSVTRLLCMLGVLAAGTAVAFVSYKQSSLKHYF
ncbi:amine oxidase [flavin-containing] B-like [Gigantopelta aegis]|uniref:amine oxidase [flavin-containing] B-like n=1 Tax=Gigantopelta aegis TaxID=1735272 RepID=UPI001B88BEB0|nr:amine oxidase [flavin-containing] B-like [Gigantopelta aegis]